MILSACPFLGRGIRAMQTDVMQILKQFDESHTRGWTEKRQFERHEFHGLLAVAAYNGKEMPSRGEYSSVTGRDISPGGVSFYINELPDSGHLVLRFGEAENEVLLIGRIMHSRQGFWTSERQYVVGCQFETRVQ